MGKSVIKCTGNKEGLTIRLTVSVSQNGQYSTSSTGENWDFVRMLWHPLFCCFLLEVLTIAKLEHQLNEEIRDKEVRLIGADGAQLGIVSALDANRMAEEQGLDLVKISPNAVPPVCKIMDYSKFCYDQKKREKDAKRNQRVVEVKEIRMSPSIDTNDFNTKVKAAAKFLADGNRVKVSVRFRGREMAHTNLGEKLLLDFAEACTDIATMEKNPKLEGRFMGMFLTPKNNK